MMLADLTLPSAPAVLGWLATYLIHSTCWLAGAWLVARGLRAAVWRGRLWKAAALGGIASAALVSLLDTSRLAWRLAPEATTPVASAITSAEDEHLARGPIALDLSAPERAVPAVASGNEAAGGSPAASTASFSAPAGDGGGFGWSWLLAAWVVVAVFGLVHLAHQHRRLARALASRRRLFSGSLFSELARLQAIAGRRRRTRLSVTSALSSPIVLARGEIVVPERALERLSPRERATLLAHELAHVVRRDAWWLLALSVVERLFAVQPLNRLATGQAMAAAELACDELAARWTRGEIELARCLVEVASWTERSPAAGLAAGLFERPSALVERVERLLNPRRAPRLQGVIVGLWLAVSLGVLACGGPRVTTAPDEDEAIAEVPVEIPEELAEMVEMSEPLAEPAEDVVVKAVLTDPHSDVTVESLDLLAGEMRARAVLEERIRQYLEAHSIEVHSFEYSGDIEERISGLEKQITVLEMERARLKPEHSQWKKIQATINQIHKELAALSSHTGSVRNQEDARITAVLEVLDGTSLAQRAHHVFPDEDGAGLFTSAVGEHVLALHRDDSIWCGDMPLVHAGSPDVRLLRHHLSAIARLMPETPMFADQPDGPQMPNGRLELRIDAAAPHYLLQRVLETCGRREVQIWQFDLVRVDEGEAGAPLRFALPRDVPVEGSEERNPLQIRIRVLGSGDPDGRRLEYRARCVTAVTTGLWGDPIPLIESRTTGELASLGFFLEDVYTTFPGPYVQIDARPGTVYAEVLAVIDLAVETGFTDITFVGEYKN